LSNLPTAEELASIGEEAFRTALDPEGTGAIDLSSGSRNAIAISVMTAMGNRLSAYAADRASASQRASATGDDLINLGRDRYRESPKADVAATGIIRLTRAGSTATTIPKGSRFGVPATSGQPAIVFQASVDTATTATGVDIPVQCTETGTKGNIALASQITSILDPLPDTTWSVDGTFMDGVPASYVFGGGAALESDDAFRARLEQIQEGAAPATLAGVLKGALQVPGVLFVTVIEPQDGTVSVFAGDANYALPAALKRSIDTSLLDWRGDGVPAIVKPYTAITVVITMTIRMSRPTSNYDTSVILAAAVAGIKTYFDGRPHPDEYYQDAIESAVFRAHDEIQTVTTSSITPSADVTRPDETAQGGYATLNRYRVTDASIHLSILGPIVS
jgi:hypothetical protein